MDAIGGGPDAPPEDPQTDPPLGSIGERRTGMDRRGDFGRRDEDRRARFRDITATAIAICGGLAILYLFFAAVGTVDLGDAIVATVIAVGLALIWVVGAYQRYRSGAIFITRRDRERRGF
jgi:hypothetical protein